MNERFRKYFDGFTWRENIYVALLLRLLLSMALFSLCRVGFYFYNLEFFPELTFTTLLPLLRGGLVFDLAAVLYINLLFIVLMLLPLNARFTSGYKVTLKYIYFITHGIALAANISDFIYYRFTLRRTTADVFEQFQNERNMGSLWLKFFVDYWYATLFWVLIMVLMIYVYNAIHYRGPQLRNKVVYYVAGILAIPLIAQLMIGGMRGGFAHSIRPITISNAGEYVKDPKHISIVLNTPFSIFRTIGKTKVQKATYYAENEVEGVFPVVHSPSGTSTFTNQNVVVIILESFSKEFIGFYNRDEENGTYKGYTPFLDSLLQYSRTFEHSFSNGRKSIDGLPSVVSSIPSLGIPYFLSPYSGNRINSLASLLRKKNYHTSFFHGAINGSMGFSAFMNLAGVEEYYGMDDYSNQSHYDGLWGIWDEKFLQFYANRLNTFPEPFFSSFFSVTSHHPFKIPAEYEKRFTGGPLVIHKCVEYTDYSLRKFFEKVSKSTWYANTLFVITADHVSSETQFDETRTAYGFYSVPIIFFKPDHSLTGMDSTISQQIDIMPTVLNYLGYDEPFIAYGRNAFDESNKPFAVNYGDNIYQFIQDDYLLQFDGSKSIALFNYKKDKLFRQNVLQEFPDVAETMEKKIKGIIQQYNNRLIEDRMTIDSSKR